MQVSLESPIQRISQRLGAANRSIIASAGSLAGTTFITSALGFFYWYVAARAFSTEAVGFAGASISTMTLLGTLGALGCGTLLIGELPRHPGREGTLILTSLITAGVVSTFFAILFALLAPMLSANFTPLRASVGTVGLFALGVGLTSITQVLDQALIGLLRSGLQLGRNTLFAASKLGLLVLIGKMVGGNTSGWMIIYLTWGAGTLLSLLLVSGIAFQKGVRWSTARPEFALLREHWRSAMKHHGLNLAIQGAGSALPIVVAGVLSAEINAYFYYAWLVSGFVFVAPLALTTALYAVGARNPTLLAHRIRFTIGVALVAGVAMNIALWSGGAHLLLSMFGKTYADNSTQTLCIIGLAVFPIIVKDHFVAIHRIHARADRAALFVATETVLELVAAAIGALYGGLLGLTIAWLVASYIMATVMAPTVYRTATQRATAE